ncbi:MAG: aminotransferase class V-fold PLP-dependent enzyme [Desulfobacteraceae bacterium]|jgi:cysteine desulfurase family protein
MEMIYCNNAATTFPKPDAVKEAVNNWFESFPSEPGRSTGEAGDIVNEARKKIACFLGITNPEDLFFSSGATESLNLIIQGLDLSGRHVITSAIEHNSVLRPLVRLKNQKNIELEIVPCDQEGHVSPADIEAAIKPNTKAVFLSHVSNVTGTIQDIDAVCHICRKNNVISVIDASQSAGYLPISIKTIKPDVLVCAGHKGLFGMPGIGVAYISQELSLQPLIIGGTGVRSDLLIQPPDRPLIYEAGTLNLPGIVSLAAGIEYITTVGIDNIQNTVSSLCERTRHHLLNHSGIRIVGPMDSWSHLAVISLVINGASPGEIAYILESAFGIVLRSGLHCAPLIHHHLNTEEGTVRVSFSVFNEMKDADAVADAVLQITDMSKC